MGRWFFYWPADLLTYMLLGKAMAPALKLRSETPQLDSMLLVPMVNPEPLCPPSSEAQFLVSEFPSVCVQNKEWIMLARLALAISYRPTKATFAGIFRTRWYDTGSSTGADSRFCRVRRRQERPQRFAINNTKGGFCIGDNIILATFCWKRSLANQPLSPSKFRWSSAPLSPLYTRSVVHLGLRTARHSAVLREWSALVLSFLAEQDHCSGVPWSYLFHQSPSVISTKSQSTYQKP